jgi:hypothetical protein
MTVALTLSNLPLDIGGQNAYPDGYVQTLLSAAAVTVTDTTGYFSLPYMIAAAKVKLIVNISALSGGSSPTLTVGYFESVDGGTSYNPTAAVTTTALAATGVVYTAAATGPLFPGGRLGLTIGGTGTPTFTVSAYLAVWNR